MKVNALCTDKVRQALKNCDKVLYCGYAPCSDPRAVVFRPYTEGVTASNIYIDSMSDENMLESACDHIVSGDVRAIVHTAFDLKETGIIQARYGLSPVMLLHRMGVLDKCIIAGGVCLDNDDLDLMAQENVPLILLPTASAGYGYGYAPVCAAISRGLSIGIGTFDGKYNPAADLDVEAEFLKLTTNAEMRAENCLSGSEIAAFLGFNGVCHE